MTGHLRATAGAASARRDFAPFVVSTVFPLGAAAIPNGSARVLAQGDLSRAARPHASSSETHTFIGFGRGRFCHQRASVGAKQHGTKTPGEPS